MCGCTTPVAIRFASVAVSRHGLSLAQIGEQLGHSQPATTARYAHLHDDVAKQNANAIGTTIAAALAKPRTARMTTKQKAAGDADAMSAVGVWGKEAVCRPVV